MCRLEGEVIAQPATVSLPVKLPTGAIYTFDFPEATHETLVDDSSANGVFASRAWPFEQAPEPLRELHDPVRDDRTDYMVSTSLSFNVIEGDPESLTGVFSVGIQWLDTDDNGVYGTFPISTTLVPVGGELPQ